MYGIQTLSNAKDEKVISLTSKSHLVAIDKRLDVLEVLATVMVSNRPAIRGTFLRFNSTVSSMTPLRKAAMPA